jgi:hypothetical protein
LFRLLQSTPDSTAKSLFQRLKKKHPEQQFVEKQLRTLQSHAGEWCITMAGKLIFIGIDDINDVSHWEYKKRLEKINKKTL